MKVITQLACGLLLAASVGCGSKPPAPSPPVPVATPGSALSSGSPSAPPTKPEQTATSSQVAPSTGAKTAESPDTNAGELRSLAARLVEKDPQGAWRISESAALEFEKRGSNVTSELVALLSDSKAEVRRGAAFYLLGKFDPQDARQVASYSALLEDSEPFLRSLGLQAVRKMQRADQIAAVPRLAGMLSSTQEASADNRASIIRLLGNLKRDSQPALEALTKAAVDDKSPKVRGACLVAISQIAPTEEALPAFRAGLADKDSSVRLVAAARLRQLGSKSSPAAEDLGNALEDAEPSVREAAAEALVLMGEAAVDALSNHLDSKQPQTRQIAIACLGKIGPDARRALPLVEKRLEDEDADVKKVAEAVARILKGS